VLAHDVPPKNSLLKNGEGNLDALSKKNRVWQIKNPDSGDPGRGFEILNAETFSCGVREGRDHGRGFRRPLDDDRDLRPDVAHAEEAARILLEE
jgi:hypothetical protein